MSPAAQADAVARLNVFSRVEPSHKSLLVDRLRQQVGPCSHPAPLRLQPCTNSFHTDLWANLAPLCLQTPPSRYAAVQENTGMRT